MKHTIFRIGSMHSLIFAALVLSFCMSLASCHAEPTVGADMHAKQMLENAQERQGLVIGQNYSGHLEYFDAGKNFDSRTAPIPTSAKLSTLSFPSTGQPDFSAHEDEWNVECHAGKCLVQNNQRRGASFSIEQSRLLTPIYWSPDGHLGFYLQKGPTWRSPARCSMEDERDIVLIDVTSGKQGIVRTVCGGFPYDQLRWFILPK